jgi:nickel/cobalt transporter (NicO) family protein
MKKFILLLLLLQNLLFGCAACQLMIPTAELSIDVDMNATKLQNIHVKWSFSDLYTQEIIRQYDKNKSEKLEKKELKLLLQSLLDYLIPKNMLTQIKYSTEDENATTLKPNYNNFAIKIENNLLLFTYDATIDVKVKDKATLSLTFEDDEAYFAFVILDAKVHGTELKHTQNIYLFTISIFFSNPESMQTQAPIKKEAPQLKEETLKPKENIAKPEESMQSNILKESILKIKSLFEAIKDEKNPLSYMLLLFFAYIYGLIHALGPGHGKTLVASYFLSNERSYSKALFVSLAIGVVHTFSAFLMTVVIYYLVNTLLAQFMNDTVFYTTKISALIIISIALYLIYTKYKAYKALRQASKAPAFTFSATPHVATCSCSSCKVDNNSTDMALIISAGIIPCPGTTTIFIFALSMGLNYAGFLSALVMSLGMSTIIFISALLSVAIRKKSQNSDSNLKKYLEYASLLVILTLGVVLLFT